MFLPRALITFTLGPLALYLIYLGGWFYFLPLAAILALGTVEYSHLIEKIGYRAPVRLLIPAAVLQWLFAPPAFQQLTGVHLPEMVDETLLVAALLAAMGYGLWRYERQARPTAPADWLATTVGVVFMGWVGSHFFRLRGLEDTLFLGWTAVAMVGTWVADSGAYLFGKRFGRHKLSPRLSPNKTVEGYGGGIVTGLIATVLLVAYLDLPLLPGVILGLLVSVVSPAGDLGISLLKRAAGVKDSGPFLPGHGGALDRIDSLVWSATMAYYLVLWIG